MLRSLHRLIIKIWWAWFYTLASVQFLIYFPFLVIIMMFPRGFNTLFWIARNMWSRIILHGSGFYLSFEDRHKLKTDTNCLLKLPSLIRIIPSSPVYLVTAAPIIISINDR